MRFLRSTTTARNAKIMHLKNKEEHTTKKQGQHISVKKRNREILIVSSFFFFFCWRRSEKVVFRCGQEYVIEKYTYK